MDVSIIIVNYNSTALVAACLRSIYQHTKGVDVEVWVVDSASADRSIERISEEFPLVQLLLLSTNEGFGRANNAAMAKASGEFLFLLNPDTELSMDAVSMFLQFMRQRSNEKVAVCGGHLYTANGKETPSYGNFPTLLQSIAASGLFILFKRYYRNYLDTGVANKEMHVREVDFVSGADMFIRRSVVERCGSFDPDFFLYFEETELCYRIRKAGYSIFLLPAVKILHHEGGTTTGTTFNAFSFYHFERSRKLFYQKAYGSLYPLLAAPFDLLNIFLRSLWGRQRGNTLRKLKLYFGAKP